MVVKAGSMVVKAGSMGGLVDGSMKAGLIVKSGGGTSQAGSIRGGELYGSLCGTLAKALLP